MSLKYRVGPDAPGHLKRLRAYFEYLDKLQNEEDVLEQYELRLDWLASYLIWPPGRFLKRVAIRTASKNEVNELSEMIIAENIDPKKNAN